MDMLELIKKRHSVRQYIEKPIEKEKRAVLDEMIAQINKDTDLNIQVFYDEPKCFDSFMGHYGKFTGANNYIALVGKKSPKCDELMGYYGEALALKAQELGLNTCWVALSHGKTKAVVNKGEKHGCILSLGYGCTQGIEHKSKDINELSNCTDSSPDWFKQGVNAAMLAPTAMNQQKFYFELLADEAVKASAKIGFYTKVDLGIAKYHFEAVTNKKVITD